jgi:hypothetical protein
LLGYLRAVFVGWLQLLNVKGSDKVKSLCNLLGISWGDPTADDDLYSKGIWIEPNLWSYGKGQHYKLKVRSIPGVEVCGVVGDICEMTLFDTLEDRIQMILTRPYSEIDFPPRLVYAPYIPKPEPFWVIKISRDGITYDDGSAIGTEVLRALMSLLESELKVRDGLAKIETYSDGSYK